MDVGWFLLFSPPPEVGKAQRSVQLRVAAGGGGKSSKSHNAAKVPQGSAAADERLRDFGQKPGYRGSRLASRLAATSAGAAKKGI